MHGLTPEEYDLYVRCKLQEDAEDIALEESFKEGKAEGIKENAIVIAKKMLKEGYPMEDISKLTELTIEEIKKLKEE